jgi:hypothetical protein
MTEFILGASTGRGRDPLPDSEEGGFGYSSMARSLQRFFGLASRCFKRQCQQRYLVPEVVPDIVSCEGVHGELVCERGG